jgi:hypothetical protein
LSSRRSGPVGYGEAVADRPFHSTENARLNRSKKRRPQRTRPDRVGHLPSSAGAAGVRCRGRPVPVPGRAGIAAGSSVRSGAGHARGVSGTGSRIRRVASTGTSRAAYRRGVVASRLRWRPAGMTRGRRGRSPPRHRRTRSGTAGSLTSATPAYPVRYSRTPGAWPLGRRRCHGTARPGSARPRDMPSATGHRTPDPSAGRGLRRHDRLDGLGSRPDVTPPLGATEPARPDGGAVTVRRRESGRR